MKIRVRSEDAKFTFWVPLFLLKSKWLIKKISRSKNSNIDIKKLEELLPLMIKELKKFKKHHKDFTLLNVESSDNEHVIIKL